MSIGVAISTYNRQRHLNDLLDTLPHDKIDQLVIVKDGGGNKYNSPPVGEFIEMVGNHGVATSKNVGLAMLMKHKHDHMFLLDDDVVVKDDDVFNMYIETACQTGVYHLLFSKINNNQLLHSTDHIDLHAQCQGAFMYIHRGVINNVGDFDQRYYNAYEHIDFYYRCVLKGLVPKFWFFPDAHGSENFLMDHPDNISTIFGNNLNSDNLNRSTNHFTNKHGKFVNSIPAEPLSAVLQDMDRIKQLYSR